MKKNIKIIALTVLILLSFTIVKSQNRDLTVKLTNPLKAGKLNVELFNGSIKIVGYSGKEVMISADGPYYPGKGNQKPVKDTSKKVSDFVSQENNLVKIKVEQPLIMNFVIKVPRNFSLVIKVLTAGDVDVEKVDGDHEVSGISGNITLSNISGSVLANNVRGNIKVDFNPVKMDAPLALSSVLGTINLSLPANVKANVKLQTDFSEIHSDFYIDEGTPGQKSKNIIRRTIGKINGGGSEIFIKTVGGNIYLRKRK